MANRTYENSIAHKHVMGITERYRLENTKKAYEGAVSYWKRQPINEWSEENILFFSEGLDLVNRLLKLKRFEQ